MCARLVKKIWCDYIIDCSCYSEENKNRHNFLCATAWIAIAAKSDVWIAITFSLLMQMPRFTYHFNSFNLLFKTVSNLVQNIAFEKNIPVPIYRATTIRFLVSHFPPAPLYGTACFHSLLDHVFIILIIDIKSGYLERICCVFV